MHRRARHWLEIEKEARAQQGVDVSFYRKTIVITIQRAASKGRHDPLETRPIGLKITKPS
jgi:hypothetical protein